MEEKLKSKLGFWCFTIIVLFLLIGGYFFTKHILDNNGKKKNQEKTKVDYKIEKSKDYIYFENEEIISSSADITYKDVVINLNTQTVLTDTLRKENNAYKENIKYIKDENLITEEIIKYNNDDLYALKFRKYEVYEYNNYVSLLINDYNYSCFDLINFDKVKSYIFNVDNGKLLKDDEVLELYDETIDSVKSKINQTLTNEQTTTEEGVEVIKITETVNDLSYALYINEYGRLYISFLVKTNDVDYNKIMEVK